MVTTYREVETTYRDLIYRFLSSRPGVETTYREWQRLNRHIGSLPALCVDADFRKRAKWLVRASGWVGGRAGVEVVGNAFRHDSLPATPTNSPSNNLVNQQPNHSPTHPTNHPSPQLFQLDHSVIPTCKHSHSTSQPSTPKARRRSSTPQCKLDRPDYTLLPPLSYPPYRICGCWV